MKKILLSAFLVLIGFSFLQLVTLESHANSIPIDNTPPLVAVQPFILYGAGGKNAGETPATADSVYIGTLNEGFVSRSQTINLKANAEAGSRVQFFANGNPLGELQYGF